MAGNVPVPTNVSGSRFKNDRGLLKTRSLFYEYAPDSSIAIFTLKDHDHEVEEGRVLPSLYLLYMLEEDPTEYLFATKHLDSWSHWEQLCESTFFKPYIARWRKELDLFMTAKAIQSIKTLAASKERGALEAEKYIAEKKWLQPAQKPTRGRPSKAELNRIANEHIQTSSQIEEDFNRLRLVSNE